MAGVRLTSKALNRIQGYQEIYIGLELTKFQDLLPVPE
jgi:hypothetical protein